MIAHIRVPRFFTEVMATDAESAGKPVIVHDSSRILGASPAAEAEGLKTGLFLNTVDLPESVDRKEFSLDELERAQNEMRQQIEQLSPVVETLELGEFLVDLDQRERFQTWFDETSDQPYPLSAAVAPTGWLARVYSHRQQPGEWIWIKPDDYRESLESVKVSEFWGLGQELMETLQEVDLKTMSEIIHLDEPDRRKLTGSDSRIFKRLLAESDPRPMSVFARPRSLSVELDTNEPLYEQGMKVIQQFQQQLRRSASLSYRLSLVIYHSGGNRDYAHEFTTPTDEVDILRVAWRRMTDGAVAGEGAKIRLDMIVGDVENYHRDPQEDAADLEILS